MKDRVIVMLLGCTLLALSGCKKPAPVRPYDIRIPPLNADLTLLTLDGVQPVPALEVELTSPSGAVTSGFTDIFGRIGYDFDDMEPGNWRAFVKEQKGRYYDSEVVFPAQDGAFSVTFRSDPKLVLEPLGTSRYAYHTQTDIRVKVHYDQGGALNIPVTLTSSNMPVSWTCAYPTVLGRDTHDGVATISVPPGQYVQPVFDLFGLVAGATPGVPSTLVKTNEATSSSSVTINRGYPITISATLQAGMGGGTMFGAWYINTVNADDITWTGGISVGYTLNASAYYGQSVNFAGSTYGTINVSGVACGAGQNDIWFTVWVDSVLGAYHESRDTGWPGCDPNPIDYTLPIKVF